MVSTTKCLLQVRNNNKLTKKTDREGIKKKKIRKKKKVVKKLLCT